MPKTKAKRQVEEDEDLELDDLEEEVDDDEDEDEAPRASKKGRKSAKGKGKAAPKKKEVVFGTAELLELINEETGRELTGRTLRPLLRKMAKLGTLDRSVGEDRTNYSWSGPNDPEVKRIVKAIRDGEFERHKQENLDKLKSGKASKKAAKKASSKKSVKRAPARDEDDEDEDEE